MNIRLMNAECSSCYLYPGETLYVRCAFEALEDAPASAPLRLFADLEFGYERIDPDRQKRYRFDSDPYPQPYAYAKGATYCHTIPVRLPDTMWGGTYTVFVGLCGEDGSPAGFFAGPREVVRSEVCDIEVAFKGVAELFVSRNRRPVSADLGTVCGEGGADRARTAGLARVRDTGSDTVLTFPVTLRENRTYDLGCVSFEYRVSDGVHSVCGVRETPGFEFLDLEARNLFLAEGYTLVTLNGGGKVIDAERSAPYGYAQKYYVRNLGILTDGNASTVVETPYLDDLIHFSVCEISGKKYASIGVTFTWRVRAFGQLPSPRVINTPEVTAKTLPGTFTDCLPYLRRGLRRASERFRDTVLYYFTIEAPGYRDTQTFAGAEEYARQMYNLTGGVRQQMILRGWQHEGHDTGYPDVFQTCARSGSFEDAARAAEEALARYNTVFAFHDNYDDMYEHNGYFDPRIAALDGKGRYYKAWIWNSGVSVITGFKKAFETGILQERVRRTVRTLPMPGHVHHIDVLAQEVRRYDFDPAVSAAAEETLQYKKKVVEEYRKYGIEVSSEGVSHPFAGEIPMCWRLVERQGPIFTEERFFPLFAMIYHGFCYYTDAGKGDQEIVNAAQLTPPGIGYYCSGRLEEFKRTYWLKVYPMLFVRDATYDSYECAGGVHTLRFGNGGTVVYDEGKDEMTVSAGGRTVTEGGNTFGPGFREGEFLGYTDSGQFSVPLDGRVTRVCELETTGARADLAFRQEAGTLTVLAGPGTGFVILTERRA